MGFFTKKTIVVTGAYGFVGSRLVNVLRDTGAWVEAIGSLDLRDPENVAAIFDEAAMPIDLVFHCAARVGGIGANRATPETFYFDNVVMNAHIVNQCARLRIPKLVCLGSVCAYPKHTPAPFIEENIWEGYPEETNAAYGVAKRALLVHLQAARQQYGLNGVILFPTNLYGPGDSFDDRKSHVIPALIKKIAHAISHGEPKVTVWGTGSATRDFLYVDDCIRALMLVAEKYDDPMPLNIGSGREIQIAGLAFLLRDIMGYHGDLELDTTMPDGQPRRVLNSARARAALGWEPTTDLVDGLAATVEWYLREVMPKEVVR